MQRQIPDSCFGAAEAHSSPLRHLGLRGDPAHWIWRYFRNHANVCTSSLQQLFVPSSRGILIHFPQCPSTFQRFKYVNSPAIFQHRRRRFPHHNSPLNPFPHIRTPKVVHRRRAQAIGRTNRKSFHHDQCRGQSW